MVRGEFTQMTIQGIQADVERFMEGIGQELPEYPQNITARTAQLRQKLIGEEVVDETIPALINLIVLSLQLPNKAAEVSALADLADGIADSIYVLVGTASAFGIDLEPVWEEVQRANMQKLDGPKREDGKQLKPEDWKAPEVERIIREQIAEHDFADRSIG